MLKKLAFSPSTILYIIPLNNSFIAIGKKLLFQIHFFYEVLKKSFKKVLN